MFSVFKSKENHMRQKTTEVNKFKVSTSMLNIINIIMRQIKSPSSSVIFVMVRLLNEDMQAHPLLTVHPSHAAPVPKTDIRGHIPN